MVSSDLLRYLKSHIMVMFRQLYLLPFHLLIYKSTDLVFLMIYLVVVTMIIPQNVGNINIFAVLNRKAVFKNQMYLLSKM